MITTSRNIHYLAGRLTTGTRYASTATTGTASFTERGISYDKAGGMLALQRYGQNASFTYDDCGRTTYDGVSSLNYVYDQIGALASVSDASTSVTLTTYRHLADGTKYATVSPSGGALLYRGPFTLKVADISASTPSVSFLRAETGSAGAAIIANASGSGAAPYYYVTDQLGSVRAVVDSQGSVVERNDYYTYGKRHTTGRTYADLKNSPLLFSGKEDQGQALDIASGTTTPSNLRILDFGARHYDPIVPRWTIPDPLAEKYFPIKTYAYCAGNPVNLVDPKGMMFTERSMKYVNRVVSFSHERIAELFTAKEQLTTMLKLRKLNPRFSKLIEKVFSSIDKSIKEFRATLKEIGILSDSNQLYDITTGGIIDQNGSCISDTNYEHSNNSVLISLADNNIFTIAHELKHAFQFEIGQINFTVGPYSTIDKTDEIEAYVRGEYFGGPH